MPVPIIAPLFVEDDSVLSKRHLDLATGDVQSKQGNGSRSGDVEDQPFGGRGLDVEGKVRPGAREEHSSAVKMAEKKLRKDLGAGSKPRYLWLRSSCARV